MPFQKVCRCCAALQTSRYLGLGWGKEKTPHAQMQGGFSETLALCSTQARLRSSATNLSAVGQMTCTSTVCWTQPGMWSSQCLKSTSSPIAEVDDERLKLPVSTTDFYSFLQPGCPLELPGDLANTAQVLLPDAAFLGSGMRCEHLFVSSLGSQTVPVDSQDWETLDLADTICDFLKQWDALICPVTLKLQSVL